MGTKTNLETHVFVWLFRKGLPSKRWVAICWGISACITSKCATKHPLSAHTTACIKPIFFGGPCNQVLEASLKNPPCNQVLEASLKNPEALRLASRHFKTHDIRSQDMQQLRLKQVGLVEHDRQSEAIIVNHSSTSSHTLHDELFFYRSHITKGFYEAACVHVSAVIVLVHSISHIDS